MPRAKKPAKKIAKKTKKQAEQRTIVEAKNGGAVIIEGGKVMKSFRNRAEAEKEL